MRLPLTRVYSLTQETSLREIDDLRQRIYHLRGDDRVSVVPLFNLTLLHLITSLSALRSTLPSVNTTRRRRRQTRPGDRA